MKNVIFGACESGLSIKKAIQNSGMEVDYFVDNDCKKQTIYEGIEVISPDKLNEISEKYKINVYIVCSSIDEIVIQLKGMRFRGNVYGVKKDKLKPNQTFIECIYMIDINKPQLSYLEYEVSGHCNLNCKGCTHFSNLEKKEIFGNIDNFSQDIKRLKELFRGIKIIRLLGGEPLLNPELPKFYRIARKFFPDSKIQVVTNGLLIPTMSSEILDEMELLQIEFDITQYLPTSRIIDKIKAKLEERQVKYYVSPLVENFFDRNNFNGDSKIEESFSKCTSRGCHFLHNGKLAVCPRPFTFKRVENSNIDNALLESDIINIYDSNMSGEYINERISKPANTCRYCYPQNKLKYFRWQPDRN